VVAFAEPRPQTRTLFADRFDVDSSLAFETWEHFHKASAEAIQTVGKRLADAVVIAVQDSMHAELVVAFAAQGYDILCEKPMATSIEHCLQIEDAVKKAGIIFGLGHGMYCALLSMHTHPSSHDINAADLICRPSFTVFAIFS
jgi:predicted dehydrogenase